MDTIFEMQSYSDYLPSWVGIINGESIAECVVPDTMPDIESVIDADGLLSIRSKEIADGQLTVECEISVGILYRSEEMNSLYPLAVNMKCILESPVTADDNCLTRAKLNLSPFDVKIINSRKISVRAGVFGECGCYAKRTSELICGVKENEAKVECLQQNLDVYLISDIREKTFVVTDEIPLPDVPVTAAEILSRCVCLKSLSNSYSGSKLIFKGSASIFLLIRQDTTITPYNHDFEFTQIIESDVSPESIPEVALALTGAYFDLPERNGGKIGIELHLLAQILCRKKERLNYLADVYSNEHILDIGYESRTENVSIRDVSIRQTLNVNTEANENGGELLYAKCYLLNAAIADNVINLSLLAKAVYRSKDGDYYTYSRRIQQAIETQIEDGEMLSLEQYSVSTVFCSISGSLLEFRIPLELQLKAYRSSKMEYICSIENTESKLPESPSLTLLKCSGEDSLWALAKKHHSTKAAIIAANDGKIDGIILVPKCR